MTETQSRPLLDILVEQREGRDTRTTWHFRTTLGHRVMTWAYTHRNPHGRHVTVDA